MANRWKRNLALAGISSRCYTVDDMELVEQFKQTTKYKKWKESKDKEVKNLSRKVGRRKALEEVYKDYTPEHRRFKVVSKPRLIIWVLI